MRRLILFILVTAAVIFAAVWLADRPGEVTIRWQGWRIDTSVPVLLMLVLAGLAVLVFIGRTLRAVIETPKRWLAERRHRREREGYRALTDGMAAIASGDPGRAKKLAKRADKLLADRSLTGLLNAQTAQLNGDEIEARRRFKDMLNRPETAFLGLKGLMALALKHDDRDAALDYARRAWALKPGAEDLAQILFDLQMRAGQWAEAEITLDEAHRKGALSGADFKHRQAVALLERARHASDPGEALDLALKAHRADPMLVAAGAEAAERLHHAGKTRKAQAVIDASWRAAPHPSLVEAAIMLAPAETPLQRVKRLEKLVKTNPDAADGHIALAEAAMAAKLWGHARTHLTTAAELRPTAGTFISLARLEREEKGDEAAAQGWLAKSTDAPAEPAWTCTACGKPADAWSALCPTCNAPDTLEWR